MTLALGWIHIYGLLIGVGVLMGLLIVERVTRFFKQDTRWLDASLPWIVVGAVLGARDYHLVTDSQLYLHASWIDLLAVWRGGLGFLGTVIGGLAGFWLWASRQKLTFLKFFSYLDLLSFGVPPAQAIGRLGNFVNQELYGLPTQLPWGITIGEKRYHPLFLYEIIGNLLLFAFMIALAKRRALKLGKGQYASIYLFGYAFMRFWLEYLRMETARVSGILGIFSIAQWLCLLSMVVATVIFWVRRHAPEKEWDWSLE